MAGTYKAAFPACGPAVWAADGRRAYRGGTSGPSFDADAQAYFDEVSLSDPAYTVPINQFVLDLKAASLWTKFDRLWVLANADATAALTCIKSLEVATPVNTPTFTAGQGYAGDGTTSYLDTNFVPSTDGVNYAQDSAAVIDYIRTANNQSGGYDIATTGGGHNSWLISRFTADFTAYASNNTGAGDLASVVVANGVGLYISTRVAASGAGAQVLYKAGSSIATGTQASTGLPTASFFIGGRNNGGTPAQISNGQHSLVGFSSALNASDVTAFGTAFGTLQTAIGF